VAVLLRLGARLAADPALAADLTLICYDNEEVEADRNGLGRVARDRPDWLAADLAVLLEPTSGQVEAGCQGTLRAEVRTSGRRAHSARSWLGVNAIHAAAPVLTRLAGYEPRSVDIDGCVYREGLNAVGIAGGVAGNVLPDECLVTVNFRFAPDRSVADAEAHVRSVFAGLAASVSIVDSAPGALPGLSAPAARDFVAAVGTAPVAKYGWTDVSRFAALGIPAVNFGPGDPNLAHTREEHVVLARIAECEDALRGYLTRSTR
jgi:succinyl-diaminopimelate desuccinylase